MRFSLVWVLLLGSHLQNAVLGVSFFFLFSFVVAVVFNTFASPSAGGKCSSQEERERLFLERSSCVLGDGLEVRPVFRLIPEQLHGDLSRWAVEAVRSA